MSFQHQHGNVVELRGVAGIGVDRVENPVDEIGDVLDLDAASYERPPENLEPEAKELIRGVYKLTDHLLLVLDEERTVDLAVGRER